MGTRGPWVGRSGPHFTEGLRPAGQPTPGGNAARLEHSLARGGPSVPTAAIGTRWCCGDG